LIQKGKKTSHIIMGKNRFRISSWIAMTTQELVLNFLIIFTIKPSSKIKMNISLTLTANKLKKNTKLNLKN